MNHEPVQWWGPRERDVQGSEKTFHSERTKGQRRQPPKVWERLSPGTVRAIEWADERRQDPFVVFPAKCVLYEAPLWGMNDLIVYFYSDADSRPDTINPADLDSPSGDWTVYPEELRDAQTHRRQRAAQGLGSAVLLNGGRWNPDDYCISAIFGCDRPITRHTDPSTHQPTECCDLCWKFCKRHDGRWPNADDIKRRHARAARALNRSRGNSDD
jgi:hypothetical protein